MTIEGRSLKLGGARVAKYNQVAGGTLAVADLF